jgi:hypothetical protein
MRRGRKLSVNAQSPISPVAGDDTIDLELTPEQLLDLSQAMEAAVPCAPAPISTVAEADRVSPAFPAPQLFFKVRGSSHLRRWHRTPIVKVAATIIAYAAFAWWSASHFGEQPQQATMAAIRPTVVGTRPVLMRSPAKPALRFVNPFDATEVFEFPAGTSHAERREKVAQILLQRARERQIQWVRINPVISLRTASLYRSP